MELQALTNLTLNKPLECHNHYFEVFCQYFNSIIPKLCQISLILWSFLVIKDAMAQTLWFEILQCHVHPQ